jgi:hypothetical protein
MDALHERFRGALPRLTPDNYRVSSLASEQYNCIAWAANQIDIWWWPVEGRYWPEGLPREETIEAFQAAFDTLGYVPGPDAGHVEGWEKVALYAVGGKPTHAARQLPNGWWTSKLGPNFDIEHLSPEIVGGGVYGDVVVILGRRTQP